MSGHGEALTGAARALHERDTPLTEAKTVSLRERTHTHTHTHTHNSTPDKLKTFNSHHKVHGICLLGLTLFE